MQNPWTSLMCGTASMILGLSILVEFRQDVATLLLRFTIAMEDTRIWLLRHSIITDIGA